MKICSRLSLSKALGLVMLALGMMLASTSAALSEGPAVRKEDGRYFDKDDNPIYNVQKDGTVDWGTYSGFRRYHSECHVCHGPDGLGSTYAPALANSLKTMTYDDFLNVVVNGRKIVRPDKVSEMPAFGENLNVMCFIDDIYTYLKARSDGAVGRGRPRKREPKPEAAKEHEKACFGRS